MNSGIDAQQVFLNCEVNHLTVIVPLKHEMSCALEKAAWENSPCLLHGN